MKKVLSVLLLLTFSGCASVSIPNYIHDKHPKLQTFYVSFDLVHAATLKALDDLGWTVENESDPALFERGRESKDSNRQQTLIFTNIRQFLFFVGSKYDRLNVLLHVTAEKATEVEIRYLKVTSLPFKTFNNYKNDRLVKRLFKCIEENLK